jgi:phosphatidylinositol kinase/protein kinase (PI-3  family)
MPTLAKPKVLHLRGSDGEKYDVLCKPEDELRKDARFMDLARMLNIRSVTNKYTRNLALKIRTFHVLPLQEAGGIIEWVENMKTIGECVDNGKCKSKTELDSIRVQIRSKVCLKSTSLY